MSSIRVKKGKKIKWDSEMIRELMKLSGVSEDTLKKNIIMICLIVENKK